MAYINNNDNGNNVGDFTMTESEFASFDKSKYADGTQVITLDDAGTSGIQHIYVLKDGDWAVLA